MPASQSVHKPALYQVAMSEITAPDTKLVIGAPPDPELSAYPASQKAPELGAAELAPLNQHRPASGCGHSELEVEDTRMPQLWRQGVAALAFPLDPGSYGSGISQLG